MGAGRKKGSATAPPSKVLGVRVELDLFEALERRARERDLTLPDLLRQTLARLVGGRRPRPRRHKAAKAGNAAVAKYVRHKKRLGRNDG